MAEASVESASNAWAEGSRRLEEYSSDPTLHERLLDQVAVLADELERRVGQTFTLGELAEVYRTADKWARDAVAEHSRGAPWRATFSVVEDAAFHLYARGASDYWP